MDNEEPKLSLGVPRRHKKSKIPNPANDQRRARDHAQREGHLLVPPPPPVSLIPPFPNSQILRDWTLLEGTFGPVFDQVGDTCGSVGLCRLFQAHHNRNKPVASHHQFSIKDLADYMKTKTKKLSISNLNIALDYIVDPGLLKHNDDREAGRRSRHRVEGRFEVQNGISKDEVYNQLEQGPLAISLEDTRGLKHLTAEEIYDVPLHRAEKGPHGQLGHAVIIAAKGITPEGKEFLVIQNSWGVDWCNRGYGRISLDPAGKFDVFWCTQTLKK